MDSEIHCSEAPRHFLTTTFQSSAAVDTQSLTLRNKTNSIIHFHQNIIDF